MDKFKDLEKLDKEKIFDQIDFQPDRLRLNYGPIQKEQLSSAMGEGIENIALAGMGGSALSADILKNWLYDRLKVPLEIVRGYNLPDYLNTRSLVVISSYSGNTEEALACLAEAEKLNTQIVIMTAGGQLAEIANQKNYTFLKLPKVSYPRLSVMSSLKALTILVESLGLSEGVDLGRELLEAANFLDTEKAALGLDDTHDNLAREIAEKLYGKSVIIYAGPTLKSASYKWKTNINENAKQMAFSNVYSELNHNEYQGWIFPKNKDFVCIQLESDLDNDRIKKRMQITPTILSKHGYKPIIVKAKGKTLIDQLLYSIMLGDYVSAYLAILNGVDPTPVDLIEELKKKLK